MSEPASWYGWCRLFGRWCRLTGPHEDPGDAGRALDAEIIRRRICVHQRWCRLIAGEQRPRD